MTKTLIVGNNVAGTNLAKALRDADAHAEIEVFSDESTPYYPRPKLIDFVSGTVKESEMPFYPTEWYLKNNIKLKLGVKVEDLDPKGKRILVNGSWTAYDKLALATGSSSFIPPLKGLPKPEVLGLRTLEDARRIRELAAKSKNVIVIGGGLLGLETARAISSGFPNATVTILEYAEHLLMRQLDHDGAAILQKWVEGTGVKVLVKAETDEVLGDGRVTGVRLKDGRTVPGNMVVISAGTRSNLALAKAAGVKTNRGIIVDSSMRTSEPDIFALGDACEYGGAVWAMIPPALEQARVAAKKMLGQAGPEYKGTIPSNTLKVVGLDMFSMGKVRSEHEPPESGFEEIRATAADGRIYKKFVVKDDRLIGAIMLGTKKDVNKVTRLIKEGTPITDIKPSLSNPDFAFP